MDVKILKSFTDKYNRSVKYKAGDIVEMTASRADEANSTWRGKLVEIISGGEETLRNKPGRKPRIKED